MITSRRTIYLDRQQTLKTQRKRGYNPAAAHRLPDQRPRWKTRSGPDQTGRPRPAICPRSASSTGPAICGPSSPLPAAGAAAGRETASPGSVSAMDTARAAQHKRKQDAQEVTHRPRSTDPAFPFPAPARSARLRWRINPAPDQTAEARPDQQRSSPGPRSIPLRELRRGGPDAREKAPAAGRTVCPFPPRSAAAACPFSLAPAPPIWYN